MCAAVLRLPPLPTIRDLIRLYRLKALKQLSQNFLLDERITDRIVKSAGDISGHYVCEVGPGPGGITRSIIKKHPRKLIVIEKDERFLPTLELLQEASQGFVDMHIEINDVRDFNFENALSEVPKEDWLGSPPPINIIGNLPFSISTNLVIRWLKAISQKQSAWAFGRSKMTLTFQKEVAERMKAPVTHKQRCRLSVMCQLWCNVKHKFTIPGRAFIPKPKVDVGVVTLEPLKEPFVDLPFEMVEKVLRHFFNMRQKISLKSALRLFPEELREELGEKLFILADVDSNARPFEITTEEYARLCYAYKLLCDDYPQIVDFDFRIRRKDIIGSY
ncbi:dimethyladenosine transferase 1, mitochondrial [Agrilus planipennis]|uniref:rRNA adenine N(6)-methyltransferase n=1 Tax=Agrilus planipennis TaxID=224129 RepID=A0A1W4XU91_AGRPL|nr:dimethyladenosine transferase 1, mitochondrial [Agrilus planipennis]